MISPIDVLVITTDSPSGTEIVKHLKPVSSHIVAGTNLFSDFFGGMSDVFGGRSQSYQNQLTTIYNEAIEKIKHEAYKLGGNCVVGLKIDIDEISGKGKSMFMITAIGTAVIIRSGVEKKENLNSHNGVIGRDQVNHLKKLRSIIEQSKIKKLKLTDENWDFIIQNQVPEVYPEIIRQLKIFINQSSNYPGETVKNFQVKTRMYLNSLKIHDSENLVYTSLKEEGESIRTFLIQFIRDYALLNITMCMNLISDNDLEVKKIGLIVSIYDKDFYSQEDLKNFNELILIISQNFKERGTIESKTTLLSSKEKEIWKCECGKSNKIEEEYCHKCSRDIFGFSSREDKPKEVIEYIQNKVSLIEELRSDVK